jgi:hypothetical protein
MVQADERISSRAAAIALMKHHYTVSPLLP